MLNLGTGTFKIRCSLSAYCCKLMAGSLAKAVNVVLLSGLTVVSGTEPAAAVLDVGFSAGVPCVDGFMKAGRLCNVVSPQITLPTVAIWPDG